MRVIPALAALLLVGACASPAPPSSSQRTTDQSSTVQAPQFAKAPAGVQKMRKTLRSDPTTDGYAQRYPMRYDAGTWRMYNRLKRQQQHAKKRNKQRSRSAERAERRKIVRSSWLFQDKLWAVARSVMTLNAKDTQALMTNLQHGLEQTAKDAPQRCAKISVGVPGVITALPDKHRNTYKQQIRAAIINRARPPQYSIPAKRVKSLMVQNHRDIGQRFPDRNQWPSKFSKLSAEQARKRCEVRIVQLSWMNALPMPERIGLQRIWLSSLNERASLAAWKTYFSYNKPAKTLTISGPMAPHLPLKLSRHLKKYPDTKKIILDSPGGLQHVGYQLAQTIRRRNIQVHVSQICFSACTVALLGAKQRTASQSAMIGFHDGTRSGVSTKSLSTNLDAYRRYYKGLSDTILEKIRDTPNSTLWLPNESELLAANVITKTIQAPDAKSINTLISDQSWPISTALAADIKTNERFWQTQADRLADLQANGLKRKSISNYIYDDHLANLRAYRINIPDDFVEQTLNFRMRLLQKMIEQKKGDCIRAFTGEPQPSAFKRVLPEFYNEQQALLSKLITTSGPLKVARWNAKRTRLATKELLQFLLKNQDWNPTARRWTIQNLGNPIAPISNKRTCYSLHAVLDRLNNAKPAEQGPLLRSLQSSMTRWSRKDRYGQRLPWADRAESGAAL